MDFSFEKTNSAYMLFYERCNSPEGEQCGSKEGDSEVAETSTHINHSPPQSQNQCSPSFELSKELEDWIWQDNMHFLRDKNIFEHNYFKYVFPFLLEK